MTANNNNAQANEALWLLLQEYEQAKTRCVRQQQMLDAQVETRIKRLKIMKQLAEHRIHTAFLQQRQQFLYFCQHLIGCNVIRCKWCNKLMKTVKESQEHLQSHTGMFSVIVGTHNCGIIISNAR